jgi:CBS domain-containing protein
MGIFYGARAGFRKPIADRASSRGSTVRRDSGGRRRQTARGGRDPRETARPHVRTERYSICVTLTQGAAMTVGEICQHNVIVVPKGETVVDAAKRMRMGHVGDVIVVEQHHGSRVPIGILTDRDIVLSIVASDPGHLPFLTVDDAMSSDLVTARQDVNVTDALNTMREHGVRRLPIVDAAGALVGIVTTEDLLRFVAGEVDGLVDLMSREHEMERQRRL